MGDFVGGDREESSEMGEGEEALRGIVKEVGCSTGFGCGAGML